MAAAVLAAVLLSAPAAAAAAETAPLVPNAQAEQRCEERVKSFGKTRGYRGVSASDKWMRQVRINGVMLDLRVFTAMGDEVTFQEKLDRASTGGQDICLYMHADSDAENLMLQMDQHAIDVLKRVGVTEIVLADFSGCVRLMYTVEELGQARAALELDGEEQLCVSGVNDPITVVSEDGVRRQITY